MEKTESENFVCAAPLSKQRVFTIQSFGFLTIHFFVVLLIANMGNYNDFTKNAYSNRISLLIISVIFFIFFLLAACFFKNQIIGYALYAGITFALGFILGIYETRFNTNTISIGLIYLLILSTIYTIYAVVSNNIDIRETKMLFFLVTTFICMNTLLVWYCFNIKDSARMIKIASTAWFFGLFIGVVWYAQLCGIGHKLNLNLFMYPTISLYSNIIDFPLHCCEFANAVYQEKPRKLNFREHDFEEENISLNKTEDEIRLQ